MDSGLSPVPEWQAGHVLASSPKGAPPGTATPAGLPRARKPSTKLAAAVSTAPTKKRKSGAGQQVGAGWCSAVPVAERQPDWPTLPVCLPARPPLEQTLQVPRPEAPDAVHPKPKRPQSAYLFFLADYRVLAKVGRGTLPLTAAVLPSTELRTW